MVVSVGDDAPDFTLVGEDMKNYTLSSFKGKKVVLNFFPNAFSGDAEGGCEFQLCSAKPLVDAGVTVFGISHDWVFQNKAFKEKIELSYTLLSDPGREMIEKYVGVFDKGAFFDKVELFQPGHTAMPAGNRGCVVVGEDGKVVYAYVSKGEDGLPHPGVIPPMNEIKAALGL
ncbi:unnamed protein product [Discosporangium mesarthrocarpum]